MFRIVLFVFLLACSSTATRAAVLFNTNANWKYFPGLTEASSPDTSAWRQAGFDDSAWAAGPGAFYYGEPLTGTVLSTMSGRFTTLYIRKTFVLTNAAEIGLLQLGTYSDDGFIAWINGSEVARFNMPGGAVAYTGAASSAIEPTFNAYQITNLSMLVNGTNVVAIQACNASLSGSSDFVIDGSLSYLVADNVPPTITAISPGSGTLSNLTQITVTFSEPVTNVEPQDFLLNGSPAASLTGGGAVYTFHFPQPAYGPVAITWTSAHGIIDLGYPPNSFNATLPGATWSYTLEDTMPPLVSATIPSPGSTIPNLLQIEVVFSEAVTGVDAADLLVNGVPATGLMMLNPGDYLFQLAPGITGAVQVAWAAGHGIRDTATPPISFSGTSWTYHVDPNMASADLVITEFMAVNNRTRADEDGDYSDWVEIYNAGGSVADLAGWYLTDNPDNLTKWRFPSTNLAAGAYMLVWASEKDRTRPGAPLHTNFRLSSGGEAVLLVRPNGTVASGITNYAPQIADVSYGRPTLSAPTTILAPGAPGRVLAPTNDSLGFTWTASAFNDSAWTPVENGVGFETIAATPSLIGAFASDVSGLMHNRQSTLYFRLPFVLPDPGAVDYLNLRLKYDDGFVAYLNGEEVARRNAPGVRAKVADTVAEFSGQQGQSGWRYGYYNKTLDGNRIYEVTDFIAFQGGEGPHSATNYWTGSIWDWFAGNPPWTELTAEGGHPNGDNNGQVHWVIRRWTSTVNGGLELMLRVAKSNPNCGNGVTGYVFHNGVPVLNLPIAFNNAGGVFTNVSIPFAAVGDMIDIAIGPEGPDGLSNDGCDGSILTAVITNIVTTPLAWDSTAAGSRPNSQALVYEDIDVTHALDGLTAGTNYLAIHGLNVSATNSDFLAVAELQTQSVSLQRDAVRYFPVPTPGGGNNSGTLNLGPIISEADHTPAEPRDEEDIFVTAKITPAFAPVASASLRYRVMFLAETNLAMFDDGLHGDGAAGDAIFGARIPASSISVPGQMIRWFIQAADNQGRTSRFPPFTDPNNSPQYLGTIVHLPQTNNLPIFHMFAPSPTGADSASGTKFSLYYDGELYDNVGVNIHGQSSQGFPKKSYDIDFNPGYGFRYDRNEARVDDINFMTTYPDKAKMRNMLAYETYRDAGAPYHWTFPVRVQQNGVFWGDAHLMENGDAGFLDRMGLDPEGAFYKMYNDFQDAADTTIGLNAAEKKTRKDEGNADLVSLLNGVKLVNPTARTAFIFDNLNVPEVINYLAAMVIIANVDCCHKNYYFYRDTRGTGEWQIFPWDVDLSFGRVWNSASTYFDDNMYPTNYYGGNPLWIGNNNGVMAAVYNTPELREMYLRRVRTLAEEIQQPPNTSPYLLKYERRIDEIAGLLGPDAALDFAKWTTWGIRQTLTQAVDILKTQYMEPRRRALFVTYSVTNGGEIPLGQPADVTLNLGAIEYNPASGNQAEEYIEIINTNNFAVDISSWSLGGGIEHQFIGGTVIPANKRLYVSPDVRAFRARTTSPRGGQGLFVQGDYHGQLSARGEFVTLTDKTGRLVSSNSYPGTPSPAQQSLRITELMYHPSPVPNSPWAADDFEYIELKNIGAQPINLAGIRLANGVNFTFTSGALAELAPGARVLVVRNVAAFVSRYGEGRPIAGQYTGLLENEGERIQLLDAQNEEILDFSYNDSWYPVTDGLGFSLVIANENVDPDLWDVRESWRPSGSPTGAPGEVDVQPAAIAPVLVNEVLSASTPPNVDWIELHNPTSNAVNVGGWFISDDFNTPAKYRIPNGTTIAAGGYLVIDETAFNANPGVPPSFAFSSGGDECWLFSGNPNGTNLTGYYHGFRFGAGDPSVTFGRYVTSLGKEEFPAQATPTPGAANSPPLVGPIVISEFMYHPPGLAAAEEEEWFEYVELHNLASTNVPLSTGGTAWALRDAVDFIFPPGTTIPAGGYLLVVGFNPTNAALLTTFRAHYGLPQNVPVLGPYSGRLANSGESLELVKPGLPSAEVLVDKVNYRDSGDWPEVADGFGAALHRRNAIAYGNDPVSWAAAYPSPAAAYTAGQAPVITAQPVSVSPLISQSAMLAVQASGAGPLRYQWQFDGSSIEGATNSVLVLANIGLAQEGDYNVAVFNPAGSVLSSNATVQVRIPAYIQTQPRDQNLRPGASANFTIVASSTSPIHYQWLFNGQPIPGATGPGLAITNVTANHQGVYVVEVTDNTGTIQSAPAVLRLLVDPVIIQPPLSAQVPRGGSVTLSVVVSNSATLPLGFRWRIGTASLPLLEQNSHTNFFTFTNIQANLAVTVVVTNFARSSGVLSARADITVLADNDADGLPDIWEDANGLNTNNASDRMLDMDGDGMTSWEEYIAGTDHRDANSYLRVDIAAPAGNEVGFIAISNRTYTVQFSDALGSGWSTLADVPAYATNRIEILLDSSAQPGKRFYRLVTPRQP